MGAQHGEHVEQTVEARVKPAHPAADGRCQRHPLGIDNPFRKQFLDPRERHATHVRIARVIEREVVPQNSSAGAHPFPHAMRQPDLERHIENGCEHGGLINDIKT